MKKTILVLVFLALAFAVFGNGQAAGEEAFPTKPVRVIAYTAPGGLIDITARKFTEIAAKYTDATFVVENKTGAGGIVAMQYMLESPADGYNIMAVTKSNVAKVISTDTDLELLAFNWLAMLMADPEAIITNNQMDAHTWEQIVADAKAKGGDQIWVGPAAGGLDHVTAMKVWEKAGIEAKWVPFSSGGKAVAALLGEQGVAYVGNPRDIVGKAENLKIAAVSSKKRLEQFPDVPTFAELGIDGLDSEIMWRGFALQKDVPADVINWYNDLFAKVTDDPEWREFWEPYGIEVVHYKSDQFGRIVEQDIEDFGNYLNK
jgi:tripartite-type tricarboxylate transporter receptor subunit TctC